MPGQTYDLELSGPLLDGTTLNLGLMLAPSDQEGGPRLVGDTIAATSGDTPLSQDLRTRAWKNQGRGVGIDYDGAYGVYTRTPGYVCPAGAATPVTFLGTGTSNTPIVAFAEYNGDLYIAQEGLNTVGSYGRVIKLAGGTGAISVEMRIGTAPTVLAGSSAFIRDMLVADDGAGNTVLFVSASDSNNLNGVLYRRDSAGTWTTSGAVFTGAAGRNRMASVHWTTSDGNSASRIVSISGKKVFAYTVPGADPMLAASWVEGVAGAGPGSLSEVGTTGRLLQIAGFRRHVYFGADDDVYDTNELGESQGLTSYLKTMLQVGNGYAILAHNGYIYVAVGRGLIRIYVGGNQYSESPIEGQCAPGWGTPAEGNFRGYVTAMCVDQGYIVAAVHDPVAKITNIFWGIDRRTVGVDTPNPLVWYGPEVVFDADYKVTRMQTSQVPATGELRLWIAAQSVAGTQVYLNWVSLPIAGSPIQDMVSGGLHRFCTDVASTAPGTVHIQMYCRIEALQDPGADEADLDILYQHTVTSRGPLDATTKMILDTRADPAPGSTTYTTVTPDVTVSPSQDLVPVATVAGHTTQWRARLFAPSGTATPPVIPVLRSIRSLVFERAPALRVLSLRVQYGDGVVNNNGGEDTEIHPNQKTAWLLAATRSGRLTLRDQQDQRWTVALRQISSGGEEWFSGGRWGKRVTTTIAAQIMAGPL